MTPSGIGRFLLFFIAPLSVLGQTGPGLCHPYPGAAAGDCLELIRGRLNDMTEISCDVKTGRATLTYQTCSIVTKCAPNQTAIDIDTMVRRTLITIGSCALSDRGSISGTYVADDGSKTCYLYASREGSCV